MTTDVEVVEDRRRHDRDDVAADAIADALLGEELHDAAGAVETVGAAAREYDRVDDGDRVVGREHIGFARARRAAAYVHRADGIRRREDDGAARRPPGHLGVSDSDAGDGSDGEIRGLTLRGGAEDRGGADHGRRENGPARQEGHRRSIILGRFHESRRRMPRAPASVRDREWRRPGERTALGLAVAAFVLRVLARWIAGTGEGGGYDFYVGIARTFADTGRLCESPYLGCAVRLPLYPILIRPFLTASGVSFGLVVLQAALGGALVYVVFRMARDLWDQQAAVVAACFACLSPYAVVHDTALQDTVLVDLLLGAAIWKLLELRSRPNAVAALAAGTMLGGAVLTTARVGVIAIAALAWAGFAGGRSVADRAKHALCVGLPLALLLGGWMARNQRVVGAWVLTTESGASLWAGNNPQTMQYLPSQSIDRSFAAALASRTAGERARLEGAGSEAAEDRIYAGMAWDYIATHKVATAKAALIKIAVPLAAYLSPVRAGPLELGFALLYLPLHVFACLGAWRARRQWRLHTLPLVVLGAFFVTSGIYWAHTSHAVCVDPIWFTYAAAAMTGARLERDTI